MEKKFHDLFFDTITLFLSNIVNEKIDVSNLKSGVYFISFISGEKVITKEFIKN